MIPRALPGRAARVALVGAAALLSACTPEEPTAAGETPGETPDKDPDATLETRDLPVRSVEWNPEATEVGGVRAVVEHGATTVVFGASGAVVFSGGLVTGSDEAVTDIAAAALIPAADHNGLWIAAADGEGQVWRLLGEQSFEVVSGLYGLSEYDVSTLSPLGDEGTVFGLPDGLAVSDGATVTWYDTGALAGVVAGADRVAGVTTDAVATLDPESGDLQTFAVPGATAVAFDDAGRLLALTPEALYRESADGLLVEIYTSEEGTLSGLASVPGRVWFGEGTRLGVVDDTGVGLSPEDTIEGEGQLTGSPTGDVWVMESGSLKRLAVDIGSEDARHVWEEEMYPIFKTSCVPCHEPGGSAGTVLSTYDAWMAHREELRARVTEKKDMPPSGFDLSDDDRAAIAAWLDANQDK